MCSPYSLLLPIWHYHHFPAKQEAQTFTSGNKIPESIPPQPAESHLEILWHADMWKWTHGNQDPQLKLTFLDFPYFVAVTAFWEVGRDCFTRCQKMQQLLIQQVSKEHWLFLQKNPHQGWFTTLSHSSLLVFWKQQNHCPIPRYPAINLPCCTPQGTQDSRAHHSLTDCQSILHTPLLRSIPQPSLLHSTVINSSHFLPCAQISFSQEDCITKTWWGHSYFFHSVLPSSSAWVPSSINGAPRLRCTTREHRCVEAAVSSVLRKQVPAHASISAEGNEELALSTTWPMQPMTTPEWSSVLFATADVTNSPSIATVEKP